MPNITRSSLSAQFSNPVADKILEYLYDYLIFAPQFFDAEHGNLISQDPMDKRPKIFDASKYVKRAYSRGETIKIPNIPRLYAQDKLADTEITDQSLNVSSVSLTITTHKYVSVVLEDSAEAFDNTAMVEEMAKREARALAEAFEDSVIATFGDFATVNGGGVGDVLSFDDFAVWNRTFFKKGVNLDHSPAWAILTPEQYSVLATTRDEFTVAGEKGLGTFNSGRIIETPHGIYALRSNRLSSSGGSATGLCFTENALMCAFAIMPRFVETRDDRKVGIRFYADFMAGVAKLRDEEGIRLNFDADSV